MQVPDLINNNVRSLVNVLPEGKKLLGIDLGTKTIVIIKASNHFEKDSKLLINPFAAHCAME